jgi:hypothetical protein
MRSSLGIIPAAVTFPRRVRFHVLDKMLFAQFSCARRIAPDALDDIFTARLRLAPLSFGGTR